MMQELTKQELELAFQMIHQAKLEKVSIQLQELTMQEWIVVEKVLELLMQEKQESKVH